MQHAYDISLPINGSSFTVSTAKVLTFAQLHGMVRLAMKKAGLANVSGVFATENIYGKGRGWHISLYDKVLTEEQKRVIEEWLEGFRKRLDLGSSEYFIEWDIFSASRYVRRHGYTSECTRIC
jgi:hypothetical protein